MTAETLTYLHSTVSTRRHGVRVPETPMYLDALLADQPLTGGLEPRLGSAHLRTLTVMGFPSQTWPGLLDDLNRLAFPYRWATRAICLDKTDATKVLGRSPLRRAADGLKQSFASGSDFAARGGASAADDSAPQSNGNAGEPAWAANMRRRQAAAHAVQTTAHAVKSGDGGGAGSSVSVSED